MNEWISDKGVCRAAPATPCILKKHLFCTPSREVDAYKFFEHGGKWAVTGQTIAYFKHVQPSTAICSHVHLLQQFFIHSSHFQPFPSISIHFCQLRPCPVIPAIYSHLQPCTAIYSHLEPFLPFSSRSIHFQPFPTIPAIYSHLQPFTAIYSHLQPCWVIFILYLFTAMYNHLQPFSAYPAIYSNN